MTDEQMLRRLEEQLLDPQFRKSRAVEDLLAESFLEFGSSGRSYNKAEVVAFLRKEQSAISASLVDFRATELAKGVMLVTFRAIQQRSASDPPEQALRSSIWKHERGRWLLVFHQGTRVP